MRMRYLLWLGCAISLTGCDTNANPEARRAEPVAPSTESAPANDTVEKADLTQGKDAKDPAVTDAAAGQLSLDKVVFTLPEGWKSKPASSSFVLAELILPKAEGDDADGRLTVSVAGGAIEANIDRWRDQFGGKPDPASEERKEINGLEVVLVDFGGEFNDQRGPLAPATKRAGYRMLAAIIPLDGELHFVKAVGPKATIAAHAERFQQFIGSVAKKQ